MTLEIDHRDFTESKVSPDREAELKDVAAEVSAGLAGEHAVEVTKLDATTGNPAVVRSSSGPVVSEDDYVERALDHMQAISPALGLTAPSAEFEADPHVQRTSSGAVAVHLQQRHQAIPIFQAAETVRFAPDGRLYETAGSTITVEHGANAEPQLAVEEAVTKVAEYVSQPDGQGESKDQFGEPLEPPSADLSGFRPKVTEQASSPDRATVLEGAPFEGGIEARLAWFPLDDGLRLAWETRLTMPGHTARFRTLVDADSGDVLYCRQLLQSVTATGNVYRVDGSQPRESVTFPLDLQSYNLPIPTDLSDFPEDWVESEKAEGNCVFAHLGDSPTTMTGIKDDGAVVFDPSDDNGDEQKILNIFYFNCFMHDYFYLLGFREGDGNFQQDNRGRGGVDRDPVDARAHSGPVQGTANMLTLEDGMPPEMNMGLVSSTDRHTAFDATVVFHEFTHGVTNRLVGGPLDNTSLDSPQSRGMGEGWSDYVPCTILDTTVVGSWVMDNPQGLREFPYDSEFPDSFGDVGSGRYTAVHNIGELWCATLMEINRRIGSNVAMQLVVDALKLSAANPSFLNMRDAILDAEANMRAAGKIDGEDIRHNLWRVFARFGMGPGAGSNGAQLDGIVADNSLPEEVPAEVD